MRPNWKVVIMANHKSSRKRIRQDIKKRLRNRYYKKTTRTAIARLRSIEDAADAQKFIPKVYSLIDKLDKKNIWHANKAANIKSSLAKYVNALASA